MLRWVKRNRDLKSEKKLKRNTFLHGNTLTKMQNEKNVVKRMLWFIDFQFGSSKFLDVQQSKNQKKEKQIKENKHLFDVSTEKLLNLKFFLDAKLHSVIWSRDFSIQFIFNLSGIAKNHFITCFRVYRHIYVWVHCVVYRSMRDT